MLHCTACSSRTVPDFELLELGGGVHRYGYRPNGQSGSWCDWLNALPDSGMQISRIVIRSGLAAVCFETPVYCDQTVNTPFEFTLVDAPDLLQMPNDMHVFASHYRDDVAVCTFPNLGGDAILIAPCPDSSHDPYIHFAQFCSNAPSACQSALWLACKNAFMRVNTPVWLSTAGGGVGWLHLRLDRRPKYYRTARYRSGPSK